MFWHQPLAPLFPGANIRVELRSIIEPQDTHATGFNSQGLGIGLTVVKELVESHGGTVTVDSAGVGLGSEFVLSLPLCRTQSPDDA